MKKILISLIASASVFAATNASANLIVNGNFEANGGSLNPWNTWGDVDLAQVGTSGSLFDSSHGMEDHYALFGSDRAKGNSGMRQSFEVKGLDTITVSFDYVFDYYDRSWADDDFLALVKEDGRSAVTITMLDLESQGYRWNSHSDTLMGSFTKEYDISEFTKDGANILFNLSEAKDNWWLGGTQSSAGIDNIAITAGSITAGSTAPVPEPSTFVLFGAAFSMLGIIKFRSRNK